MVAIKKFDKSRVVGRAPIHESTRDVQYKYCKECMEWLAEPLKKKVTMSIVKPKLNELRRCKGFARIYTTQTCRYATFNICDMLHVGKILCCTPVFTPSGRTVFRLIFVTPSMEQAFFMQLQVRYSLWQYNTLSYCQCHVVFP